MRICLSYPAVARVLPPGPTSAARIASEWPARVEPLLPAGDVPDGDRAEQPRPSAGDDQGAAVGREPQRGQRSRMIAEPGRLFRRRDVVEHDLAAGRGGQHPAVGAEGDRRDRVGRRDFQRDLGQTGQHVGQRGQRRLGGGGAVERRPLLDPSGQDGDLVACRAAAACTASAPARPAGSSRSARWTPGSPGSRIASPSSLPPRRRAANVAMLSPPEALRSSWHARQRFTRIGATWRRKLIAVRLRCGLRQGRCSREGPRQSDQRSGR